MTRFYPYPFFSDNCFVVFPVGRPLWREDGSVTYSAIADWSVTENQLPFIAVSSETCSLFVTSYDSQGLWVSDVHCGTVIYSCCWRWEGEVEYAGRLVLIFVEWLFDSLKIGLCVWDFPHERQSTAIRWYATACWIYVRLASCPQRAKSLKRLF
jgi:hypothetical protein